MIGYLIKGNNFLITCIKVLNLFLIVKEIPLFTLHNKYHY